MAYRVKSGDTLSAIAKNNNTTVDEIIRLNPSIENPNLIYAGTEINLPSSGSNSSVPSSAGSTSLNLNANGNQNGYSLGDKPNYASDNNWQGLGNALRKQDEALQRVTSQLESLRGDTTLDDIWKKFNERDPFSYDFATDPMFQNALSTYQQMGQSAMKDAVAQSSSLTGGYGNSWAQTAGQQAYNQHIQSAFENLPSYYNLALSTYQQEGETLKDKYALAAAERDRNIQEIMDQYNLEAQDAERLYNVYSDLINNERSDYWDTKNFNYKAGQDAAENARAEAEMQANGYVKQSDGTWKYVGVETDDEDKKQNDAVIALGVEEAYEREGVEGAMQFLNDRGIAAEDQDFYLSAIGVTTKYTTPRKTLTKSQALAALAANLLGKRDEFEQENKAYDLSGLVDFYDPKQGTNGYAMENNGGENGFIGLGQWLDNIDDDASISTPYGVITMEEYYNALIDGGVPQSKAKEYVVNLQKTFGVH